MSTEALARIVSLIKAAASKQDPVSDEDDPASEEFRRKVLRKYFARTATKNYLAKAASDPELVARLEKTAAGLIGGAAKSLWRGLAHMGSRPPNVMEQVMHTASGAPGVAGRSFSPMRAMGTAAGVAGGAGARVGGGAIVGKHMIDNAENTTGMSINPYTWGRGSMGRSMGIDKGEDYLNPTVANKSPEEIFKRNQQGYDASSQWIKDELAKPETQNDPNRFAELSKKLETGDVDRPRQWDPFKPGFLSGGSGPGLGRMGGLNPWADPSAATQRANMASAQKGSYGELNELQGRFKPQAGDPEEIRKLTERMQTEGASGALLPSDAAAMQQRLKFLQGRSTGDQNSEYAKQLAQQVADKQKAMTAAGMYMHKPTEASGSGGMGASWYNLGARTVPPGYQQGYGASPYGIGRAPPQQNFSYAPLYTSEHTPGGY